MSDPPSEEVLAFAARLFELARTGASAELAAYVAAGVSADLANDSGDTLLMLAAYHGHEAAVRALLAAGAAPDRANDRGQTPLAGAVFKGEDAVVAALLQAGADPDAGTPSARASAKMFGRPDLLERFDAQP